MAQIVRKERPAPTISASTMAELWAAKEAAETLDLVLRHVDVGHSVSQDLLR